MPAWIPFVFATVALLGSPGPGIAALLAVGRSERLGRGLRYLAAMQLGLALAGAVSAVGLVTALQALPVLRAALMIVSTAYLIWLAWQVAFAPLTGGPRGETPARGASLWGAFMLGAANPKAYLALAALFGSFSVTTPAFGPADQLGKWLICSAVNVVVDFAWLLVGVGLGRLTLTPRTERAINIAMGVAILLAALAAQA